MLYPIGEQHFPSIIQKGKVYIDKTGLIYNLVNNYKYVFLARPRRFGKSLLLSTIQAYYEGRKELFKGLEIEKLEKNWKHHPVYLISLSRVNPSNRDSLPALLNQQFTVWEKKLGIINSNPDFGSRFSTILIESYNKYEEKAVVLVDEYDNPLINTLTETKKIIHEYNRELLKSIYSNLKDLDSYIQFGMLAGVSRFSKMTIFSGLNNLYDLSFLNKYAAICGITEEEIKRFLWEGIETFAASRQCSPAEALQMLKSNYDGYHFSEICPDLYNPFSLLTALSNEKISDYWLETATPEFLVSRLKHCDENFADIFEGEADEIQLAASDTSFSSPVSLLYQTGYLTIKDYDKESNIYKLGLPNIEVKKGFLSTLLGEFTGKDRVKANRQAQILKQTLEEGAIETFIGQLKIFLGSIPYSVMPELTEKYFQNTLYLLFTVMGFEIEAERQTSFGRSDLVVKTQGYIYIFELKLDGSAEKALKQIEDKGYSLPYLNSDKVILKVGLNFSSKTRNLQDWKAEN